MHPDQIGLWKIDRKIGAGGMGNVYHGVHATTGQEAAIKVLPASMAREEGFVQRFHREIEALQQLSNRHIVEILEDGATDDESCYYAMEYIDGVTLTTEITNRRRIPWAEVIDITVQIATALKAAHDAGIIHRDLKPSNLMLTKDGVIKLTDFGVALRFATPRLTRTGGVVGTAEYMSPEQARGQRVTKHSDLYALGAVMYVMLTGRPPFSGQNAAEILQKQQFAQFDKPGRYVAEMPRLLEDVVCQLLEKDPAKRVPDALVLIRRLEKVRSRIEHAQHQSESETRLRPGPEPTADAALQHVEPAPHGPGPATMIRDMIREETTAGKIQSPVSRLLDNVYVLSGLLIVLIWAAWYLHGRNQVAPIDRLAEARTVMAQPAGPAWLRARDELLQPLLEEQLLPDDVDEIRQLISQADQYEFTRSLKEGTARGTSEEEEVHRLIRQAFDKYTAGDVSAAIQQIDAVTLLIDHEQRFSFLTEFLQQTRVRWQTASVTVGRKALLNRVIQQSRDLLAHDAASKEAMLALSAAVELYGSDPAVSEEIAECRRLLTSIPQPEPEIPNSHAAANGG